MRERIFTATYLHGCAAQRENVFSYRHLPQVAQAPEASHSSAYATGQERLEPRIDTNCSSRTCEKSPKLLYVKQRSLRQCCWQFLDQVGSLVRGDIVYAPDNLLTPCSNRKKRCQKR